MTHAAVFALLPVFKRQESREYIAILSGELFHHLIPTVAGTDCFEIMIAVSSAASAGIVIRDIAVFILDGGSASDSLGFYAAVGIGSEINKAVAAVSPVNVVVVIEYVRIDKHGIALVCNRKLKLAERIFKTLAHFPALRFAVFVKRHIALNAKSPHRLIIIHAEVYRFERRFALLAYSVGSLELISVHYILIAPVKLLRARVHKSQAYRRRAQDGCRYYNAFFALFLRRAFFPELYKQDKCR